MFFVYKFSRFVVLGALTFGMLAVGTIQIQAGAQQAAVGAAAKRQAQTAALQASMPTNLTPRAAKPGTSTTPKPAATTDALKKSPGATSVSSSIAPARVQTATPSLPFTGVQGQAGSGSTSTSSARVGQTAVPATPTKPAFPLPPPPHNRVIGRAPGCKYGANRSHAPWHALCMCSFYMHSLGQGSGI